MILRALMRALLPNAIKPTAPQLISAITDCLRSRRSGSNRGAQLQISKRGAGCQGLHLPPPFPPKIFSELAQRPFSTVLQPQGLAAATPQKEVN